MIPDEAPMLRTPKLSGCAWLPHLSGWSEGAGPDLATGLGFRHSHSETPGEAVGLRVSGLRLRA